MKLANIKSLLPMEYAADNKFQVYLYRAKDDAFVLNFITLFNVCIEAALKQDCTEFSFREVRYKYDIHNDFHAWEVSIYGYAPKPDNKKL